MTNASTPSESICGASSIFVGKPSDKSRKKSQSALSGREHSPPIFCPPKRCQTWLTNWSACATNSNNMAWWIMRWASGKSRSPTFSPSASNYYLEAAAAAVAVQHNPVKSILKDNFRYRAPWTFLSTHYSDYELSFVWHTICMITTVLDDVRLRW